jgi:hypothetical protein
VKPDFQVCTRIGDFPIWWKSAAKRSQSAALCLVAMKLNSLASVFISVPDIYTGQLSYLELIAALNFATEQLSLYVISFFAFFPTSHRCIFDLLDICHWDFYQMRI